MSLQRRLTVFFVVIVILPLAAAGLVVQKTVAGEAGRRGALSLGPTLDAGVVAYNEQIGALDLRLRSAVSGRRLTRLLEGDDRGNVDAYLREALAATEGLDFIAVVAEGGTILGFESGPADFEAGFENPSRHQILASASSVGPGFVLREIPVVIAREKARVDVMGGFWLDSEFIAISSNKDVHLSVLMADRVIATTATLSSPASVEVQFGEQFETELQGQAMAEARSIPDSPHVALLASAPTSAAPGTDPSATVLTSILGLLVIALIGTASLAFFLARMITRPLGELTEGAQAIAEGRFGHEIPVRSKDEIGSLAKVFNEMSSELSDTMDQLNSSRDQLQIAIRRVGETLRSTHDMTQLRESIVNTSADAVGADAAILWTFSSTRGELLPTVVRGAMDAYVDRVKVGTGIVGMVAERAISMMLPSEESGPEPAPGEPDFQALIATPVFTRDGVTSVLVNYRRMIAFTSRDMETVKFLAEQGGVAIENVLLHEDAHRMSLTDGLTGVWNRRYLQMQFRQIQATSVRFSREFSVLMLDLDRFKKINDTCGHPRGDAILVEVARRVNETLREVDTFARYGGEEFVCLLSETGPSGAASAAGKILEVIRSRPFGGEGEEEAIGLTLSIGIATFPEAGDSFKSLLEAADQALYRAKQEGRDRYCVAGNQPGAACADAR